MECYFKRSTNRASGKTGKLSQDAYQIGNVTVYIQEAINRNVGEERRMIIRLVNDVRDC